MHKEIHHSFHNKLNYDYPFIIKELLKEFEGVFNCQGKNTERYKAFLVPVTKEVKRTDKNWREITKTMSYKSQFYNYVYVAIRITNKRLLKTCKISKHVINNFFCYKFLLH